MGQIRVKKYLIINTWNGEGYSDSTANIMEFYDSFEALKHVADLAIQASMGSNIYIHKSKAEYSIGDDYGKIEAVEVDPNNLPYAVELNPDLNEFYLLPSKRNLDVLLDQIKSDKELDDYEREEIEDGDWDGNCYHTEIGATIIVQL